MARSSKDSSNMGTPGFLFDSESAEPEVDQPTSESSESSSAKAKKKRSSSKRAKQEGASQTPSETATPLSLFDEPKKSTPASVQTISAVEESVGRGVEPASKKTMVLQELSVKAGTMEIVEQSASESVVPQGVEALENGPVQEEVVSPPESVHAPIERLKTESDGEAVPEEKSVVQEKPVKAEIPAETASVQKVEEFSSTLPQSASESANASSPGKSVAYQVVARRYRPQAFDELIGQETVARALTNAIETNRVGHAYLFTGARGVGKTSCARIFAKALNCVEGPTTRPCLKCDSCIGISTGEDVDVIEIDGASNRGVDEIRQLRQNAAIAPSRSHYKIYIIDEVHMLTREAFNALLKTLEEPPARVKFIFCTTEPNKIPVTILSRCQRFDFNSINGVSIAQRLEQIAKQEGAQAEDGVFDVLARRANGSMRDAQSLLEQLLSFAPNHIALADVHNMLGSVDDGKIFDLLDATVKGDSKAVFETLGKAARLGVDFGALVEQTFGVYRDLMIVASGCGPKELAYSPVARFDDLKRIALEFGIRRILASLQILDQTIQRMRYSAQARILAELAFARLCCLDAFQTIESLINQLKSGTLPNIELNVSQPSSQTILEDDKKKTDSRLNELSVVQTIDVEPRETGVHESEQARETSASDMKIEPIPDPPQTIASVSSPASEEQPVISQSVQDDHTPWLSLPKPELAAIWTNATSSGIVLPTHASAFYEIRPETPNTFTVVFPAGRQIQRDYCDKERAVIESRISEQVGESVVLRLIVDPAIQEPVSRENDETTRLSNGQYRIQPAGAESPRTERDQSNARSTASVDYQELHRQVESNDVVPQIQDLFEAELSEIKPPASPASSIRRWGRSDD